MPLFGSRMVCETANYKYIERRDKNFGKRENALKRWVNEKRARRARLHDLKEKIQKVNATKGEPGYHLDGEGFQRSESVRSLRDAVVSSPATSPRLMIQLPIFPPPDYSPKSTPTSPLPPTTPQTPTDTHHHTINPTPRRRHGGSTRSRSSLRRDSKFGSIGFTHDINGHKLHKATAANGTNNSSAVPTIEMGANKDGYNNKDGLKGDERSLQNNKRKLKKGMLSIVNVPSNKYARLEEESLASHRGSQRFSLSESHQGFGMKEEKTTTCGSCNIL